MEDVIQKTRDKGKPVVLYQKHLYKTVQSEQFWKCTRQTEVYNISVLKVFLKVCNNYNSVLRKCS